jgi:predicted ribosome quality control (RQC) complex YloA/Tae2 family protein
MMAQLHLVEEGAEVTELPDLLGDGSMVTIRLDPTMSAVENAQRLYEKAKSTRASREVAEDRLGGLKKQMKQLDQLLEDVKGLSDASEVADFKKKHSSMLSTLQRTSADQEGIPYRRFELADGDEVWVGRNSKQNDDLTLRDARPYDVWMHARGVAGSHTVLRVKGRKDTPPKHILESAAAIAAWFSKARTSALAPVIVTQRKYVRKPRKSPAGSVRVDREDVILIEPALPD